VFVCLSVCLSVCLCVCECVCVCVNVCVCVCRFVWGMMRVSANATMDIDDVMKETFAGILVDAKVERSVVIQGFMRAHHEIEKSGNGFGKTYWGSKWRFKLFDGFYTHPHDPATGLLVDVTKRFAHLIERLEKAIEDQDPWLNKAYEEDADIKKEVLTPTLLTSREPVPNLTCMPPKRYAPSTPADRSHHPCRPTPFPASSHAPGEGQVNSENILQNLAQGAQGEGAGGRRSKGRAPCRLCCLTVETQWSGYPNAQQRSRGGSLGVKEEEEKEAGEKLSNKLN
jgi:hypothetical protein